MSWLLLPALLLTGPQDKAPLTDAQRERLTKLVHTTQKENEDLKAKLEQRQRELARHYAEFDLNEKAVTKLQAEVIDLQRKLLDNYHRLQVELRMIVGRERFVVLRQRLDRILGVSPPP